MMIEIKNNDIKYNVKGFLRNTYQCGFVKSQGIIFICILKILRHQKVNC